MHLLTNTAPRTVENQHYVMIPAEGGYKAEAVYAASPEAAVAETRRLFTTGDFGEPVPEDVNVRLAQGTELPWNNDVSVGYIIEAEGSSTLYFGTENDARETYEFIFEGRPFSIRPATPAEKEKVIRRLQVEQDDEDEEQFNYGFNVLYHEEREGL